MIYSTTARQTERNFEMRTNSTNNPAPFIVYAVDLDHGEELEVYIPCKGPTPQKALLQAKTKIDRNGRTVAVYQQVTS